MGWFFFGRGGSLSSTHFLTPEVPVAALFRAISGRSLMRRRYASWSLPIAC